MNTVYLTITRDQAITLLDRLPWRPGTGICGERRGVLAIETADAATRARLERAALGCVTSEAAFFAAPSL
jgi:hypothetical protein